ncbi:MAG: efflux RND transporter periplasmic adaptor subunit [Proteobacteria bacterium]|nr:efflux RND transporter periplasmic adaptor subunit [Pseudomonadota bacterium]
MKLKQLIPAVVSASILLLCNAPALAQEQEQQPPSLVKVSSVEFRSLVATAVMPGTVVSREDARISAEVSGRLLMVVDIGTRVEQGEAVAQIDDVRLQLRQRELLAQVEREKARLAFLRAEQERLSKLAKKNLASSTQYEQVISDRLVAESDLVVANVRLEQVRDELARSSVNAPFPGIVVAHLSNVGEHLAVGTEVLRLVNVDNLEVVTRAPLEYMEFSNKGHQLEIISDGQVLQAPIRTLVAVGSERTHVYEMRLDLPANAYPVGKALRVRIPVASRAEVLAVPRDALVLRSKGTAVFVIDADSKARQVMVETGISEQEWIEVRGDLEPGDKVVVRGAERLRPEQKVAIQEDAADAVDSSASYTDSLEFDLITEPEDEPDSYDSQ